jgi:regulatory protein
MLPRTRLTKEQALEKIKYYCAYQERCHSEVKEKLYSYGLWKTEVEELISTLIENNYLNEERFAVQFAGGKFRIKQWGRKKIQHELQQKGVASYCIKLALKGIDDEDYMETLKKLATAKWKTLGGENKLARQSKTYNYLLQKGYESALINRVNTELAGNS